MRILLIEKDPAESARLAASLADTGFHLTLAQDESATRIALQQDPAQLLMLSTRDCDESLLALLREARNSETCLNLDSMPGVERTAAPARSSTWIGAASLLAKTVEKFLGMPVSVAELSSADLPLAHGCRITMGNVQDKLELRVALGADEASARNLAVNLFGERGSDLDRDMLGEIANIAMGTLKTALSQEGIAFSAGLPETIATEQVLRPTRVFRHQETFALQMDRAKLVVHLGLRSHLNQKLTPEELCEGMVIAKDVVTPRGLTVVHGGTRLSLHTIEKLRAHLPKKTRLEVMAH